MQEEHLETGNTNSLIQSQVEAELSSRLEQQAAVARLGHSALASSNLDALFDETVHLLADTLNVEFTKIMELLPEEHSLLLRAGLGWREGLVGSARIGLGDASQTSFSLLQDEPVVVDDLPADTRFPGSWLLREHGILSGMSIAIPGKSQAFGALGVHTSHPRKFTVYDANFLKSIAHVLATAIERVRVENSLRSSRDQLDVILRGIADGVTAQDRSGRVIYANPTAARLSGFHSVSDLLNTPNSELIGRYQLLDEDGNPLPADEIPGRKAIRYGKEFSSILRFKTINSGQERWSDVKSTPVLNDRGQVDLVVNIFQDITGHKQAEQRQRFLAEAGKILSTSLDYTTTLSSVANLAVSDFADWCSVHILEGERNLVPIAVAHIDPQKVELARNAQGRYPIDWDSSSGIAHVILTGKPEFYPDVTDEMIRAVARDEEHLRLLQSVNFKAVMILPLIARERILGGLTLVWESQKGKTFPPGDISLAEELASRAALAIENAQLYKEAQQANNELEQRVERRTQQLQSLVTRLRSEVIEHKKTGEALRSSETLLNSLFESTPDAIFLTQEDGLIVRTNAEARALFSFNEEDLMGASIQAILPGLFPYRRIQIPGQALPWEQIANTRLEADFIAHKRDGSRMVVDIDYNRVSTEQGKLVIVSIRDLTARRQIEAELAETQRRLIESVEAERLSISQDLHDGPIQELYGLNFLVSGMQSGDSLPASEQVLAQLSELQHGLLQVVQMIRTMCGELRPPTLGPFGLEKAILAHIERVQETHPDLGILLDLMPDQHRLSERVRLALFRVYQNAVNNVLRHAKANHMTIRLQLNETSAQLEVSDDGRGFELPERWVELARQGHFGLVGTSERVKAIGGEVLIQSAPGKGTKIQVTVPLETTPAAVLLSNPV